MVAIPLVTLRWPSSGHWIAATGVATLIMMAAVALVPFGRVPLPPHPGFMPAFGALMVLVDTLTAGLLFAQATLARDRSTLRLAAAYLFAGAIILPHLAMVPGALAPSFLTGDSASSMWLWCAWHGGFALCVIRFATTHKVPLRPGEVGQTVMVTLAAVVALTLAATAGLEWLPRLFEHGSERRLNATGIGPAILIVTILAEFLVISRLRCRTALGTWLAVAMLAASIDVELTLFAGEPFTLGWYAARVLSLTTGMTMLFALLSELMREAGRVADANARLQHLLQEDALTGLANRRAFQTALDVEWRRASREQTAVSLLMVDIDLFKGFNDRYGHPAGDVCLRQVAAALIAHVHRASDMAARIGGEEFAILLPMAEEDGALRVAERLRCGVASLLLPHETSAFGHVTISIGVATARPYGPAMNSADLMSAADQALYRAKAAGRNIVRSMEEPLRMAANT